MADPYYIAFVLIECPISGVGNGKFAKSTATFEIKLMGMMKKVHSISVHIKMQSKGLQELYL